jgi:CRP/FNR family transcriptional regulator, cyclic AMP receptor protein
MSLTKDLGVLRNIPLFAKVDPAKLKLLVFTSERLAYLSGDELFHQGDYGDAAYIILEGGADILVETPKGTIKVASLGKNDIIGEIAILCDVPRTATVVAHAGLEALQGPKPLSGEAAFPKVPARGRPARWPETRPNVRSEP